MDRPSFGNTELLLAASLSRCFMRIITRQRIREFAQQYPDAAASLHNWERLIREAKSESLQGLRRIFPHADMVTLTPARNARLASCVNCLRLSFRIHPPPDARPRCPIDRESSRGRSSLLQRACPESEWPQEEPLAAGHGPSLRVQLPVAE